MSKVKGIKVIALLMILTFVFVGCGKPPMQPAASSAAPAVSSAAPAAPSPASSAAPAKAPAASGPVKQITIGTASVGGMNYPIGMALAKIWNANVPGVKAVAIATNGAPHNLDLLRTNDIDAAVCRAIEANKAINGVKPYPEKMPWVRAITGGLFYDATQVFALKDKGIKTIADFKGKKVAVGPVGSGGEVDAKEILAAYGLTYNDIQPQYIDATQAIEMMEDGLVDGAILGLTMGNSAASELMLSNKVLILPISDEALAKWKEKSPFMMKRLIPKNVYPNQDYEVISAGSPPDNIICRAELPEELVYKMTKSIYENLPEMQSVAAVMKQFNEKLVAEESDMLLPYHPGAKKYFLEKGWIKK